MTQAARRNDVERTGSMTKQKILATAQELFANNGYNGTTVQAIASRLDLTDPAIYYHFRSKRHIFDSLLQSSGAGQFVAADNEVPSREDLIDRMMSTFNAYARQPDMLRMLFRQQYRGDPASNQRRRETMATFQATLAPLFTRLYGETGPSVLEAVGLVTLGIIWDAILSYGHGFAQVVEQPWFAQRARKLFEIAMPPVPA